MTKSIKSLLGKASSPEFTITTDNLAGANRLNQVASFYIDGKPIRLTTMETAHIKESDTIVVAGLENDGVFIAKAYRNISNGAIGYERRSLYLTVTMFVSFMWFIFLIIAWPIFLILGFIFLPIILFQLYKWHKLKSYHNVVYNFKSP